DQQLSRGTHVEELIDVPFISCASPAYLKRRGMPSAPADCIHHQGVLLKLASRSSVTNLSKDGQYQALQWQTTSTYSSQLDAVNALVLGAGICVDIALPYFVEKNRQGLLVEVLPDWNCPSRTACLFASEAAWKKRRVRLFFHWIATRYRNRIREDLKFIRENRESQA
ncbi:MAG: LysR substrate-binding domain-containing protein, partial [Sutterella sp.]